VTTPGDPFEHADAAYVLGALERGERLAYEAHLATCERCREAVADLAGMPGLLSRVTAMPAAAAEAAGGQERPTVEPPPDLLLPGLLRAARRGRVRRRAWTGAAALVAAACLVVATLLATGAVAPPGGGGAGRSVALVGVADVPIRSSVHLAPAAWGTRITMSCRYEGAAAAGWVDGTYQLVVVPRDGSAPQTVAQWRVVPGTDADVVGSTDLAPAQIAAVQLQDGYGRVLQRGTPAA
jgi:Putative zinc-finger